MKNLILILLFGLSSWIALYPQNIQFCYDFRHSLDPANNQRNFPAFSFEYFKNIDTTGTGSFLFKLDTQLNGERNNIGQAFAQITRSLRFWKPKYRISFYYSGGLGVPQSTYGYYLTNSLGLGTDYPLQWKGAWISMGLYLRISFFDKPSFDPQINFYFGRGFLNYRIYTDGSFVFWTENKNHGIDYTQYKSMKKFAFFGDPKIWIRIRKGFSAGVKVNALYNLIENNGDIKFYPQIGTKFQF